VLWTDRSEGPTLTVRDGARLLDLCGNEVKGPVALGEVPHYLVLEGLQSPEQVRGALADAMR